MKKKPATPTPKKTIPPKPKGVGAHGSRERPKAADEGPKWPGGGRKGEDE